MGNSNDSIRNQIVLDEMKLISDNFHKSRVKEVKKWILSRS
jgi:hypothetical protein